MLVVTAAFATHAVVRAQDETQVRDWPRFHVGVAIGHAGWSVDLSEAGVSLPEPIAGMNRPAEPGTGWKVVAGFRPVRVVGVELQFVDFDEGETRGQGGQRWGGGQVGPFYEQTTDLKASADASVLTAIVFIPVAKSGWDVYGKVGVADLDVSLSTSTTRIDCVPILLPPCYNTVNSDAHQSESAPYVGIGARFPVGRAMGIRVEYEAIDRDVGDDPAMLSLGIAWER